MDCLERSPKNGGVALVGDVFVGHETVGGGGHRYSSLEAIAEAIAVPGPMSDQMSHVHPPYRDHP